MTKLALIDHCSSNYAALFACTYVQQALNGDHIKNRSGEGRGCARLIRKESTLKVLTFVSNLTKVENEKYLVAISTQQLQALK